MKTLLKRLANLVTGVALAAASLAAPAAETITYFHNDLSGSPMLATDAAGNVLWKENYRPYGDKLVNAAASATNKIGFAGKPYDGNTGLSYMGARYYDPVLGRFTGVDPQAVDPSDVHSFNRYAYANNNPYRFVDPDGHSPLDVIFLAYDLAKLGQAVYSGAGIGSAAVDVAMSVVGVASPIPGAGQAMKAARAADRAVDAAKSADKIADNVKAIRETNAARAAIPKPGSGKGAIPPAERDPKRLFTRDEVGKGLEKQGGQCPGCGKELSLSESVGHHTKRHADGGQTKADNLTVLCNPCHKQIHKPE